MYGLQIKENKIYVNKPRLTHLDVAKGIGILLVVFGHIEYIGDGVRIWLTSFHMPMFFVISGMLLSYKSEETLPIKDVVVRKCRSILLPYFWFSVLFVLVDIIDIMLKRKTVSTLVDNAIDSVSFYGVSTLWFLPTLFISEIVVLIAIKKIKNPIATIVISLMASCVGWLLMTLLERNYEIKSILLRNCAFIITRSLVAIMFIVVGFVAYRTFFGRNDFSIMELLVGIVLLIANVFISKINGVVDYRTLSLGYFPLSILCALIGAFSIILICKNMREIKLLKFFGCNSLIIMATHLQCYFVYWATLLAWQVDTVVSRAKYYVFIFNIMLFTMIMEVITIFVINKFLPFMVGKKRNK